MFELALSLILPLRQRYAAHPESDAAALVTYAYLQVDSAEGATDFEKALARTSQSGVRKIIDLVVYALKNSVTFSAAISATGGNPSDWDANFLAQINASMTSPLT